MESDIQQPATPGQLKDSALATMVIFKDDPLFGHSAFDHDSDAFNHEAFADTILKLLECNSPPLSIGLFGAWGIGKSTIVNILFDKINAQANSQLKPIYFNAWKYSGDSFRRQFLIEVAKQVYDHPDDLKQVRRLELLNYTDVLKRSHTSSVASSIVQGLKDAVDLRFTLRGSTVWRFIVGCGTLIAGWIVAALISVKSPLIAALLLTTVVPAIFVWFSQIKFEDLFIFQDAPVYDPKFIFPEQFENEFAALIQSKALKGKKAVIAIDDLDRCDPHMVQDILISMKNFIGQANCFFLVPCDDHTVVQVFSEPNQKAGYRDESLRKYFNVSLRIPPITSTDLVDFANTTARNTGIPGEVVQVAVMANCRDARKMKHFLNSFAMKYQIAKSREAAGLMPRIVDDSLPELAKAVLIEDAFPDLFAMIVENPRVYSVLETAALRPTDDNDELQTSNLLNWSTTFPGLKEILERTRDIRMEHADVFFSLKSTNTELKIPRGTELKTAIIEGNVPLVQEIAKNITDTVRRNATADLLLDLLKRSNGPFLRRSIAGALELCYGAKVFSSGDSRRVATSTVQALLYRDVSGILNQQSTYVLECAEESGNSYMDQTLSSYYEAITGYKEAVPLPDLKNLVNGLYRYSPDKARFAALINDKFGLWINGLEGLTALANLETASDLPAHERIPSEKVVEAVLDALIPLGVEFGNNLVRRTIIFANWESKYGLVLVPKLTAMLQGVPPDEKYSSELRFVIESILSNHRLVEEPLAHQLWTLLPGQYNRITETQGKLDICKAAIIFALKATDINSRASSKDFVLSIWKTLSDPALRENLDFVTSTQSTESTGLLQAAISQELGTINSEIQAPTDHTSERIDLCLDYRECLTPDAVEQVLSQALDVSQDEALERWIGIINRNQKRLSSTLPNEVATRSLALVRPGASRPQRQALLLRCFVEMLRSLDAERKRELSREYFLLLRDSEQNTRNAAATILLDVKSSLASIEEFKISVGNLLGDLRKDVRTPDLLQYRAVFEAVLNQSELFGEYQWRDIADLSKRALSQPDTALQEFGLGLVERMDTIPESEQNEVLRLLVNLEGSGATHKDRATSKLDLLTRAKLTDSARAIMEDRKPKLE